MADVFLIQVHVPIKYLNVVSCKEWILLGKNYLNFNFLGTAALGWMLPHWTILLVLKKAIE